MSKKCCRFILFFAFISFSSFPNLLNNSENERNTDTLLHTFQNEEYPVYGGWRLIWQDEFNDSQLNLNYWQIKHGELDKKEELHFYAGDHVYLHDGQLHIKTTNLPQGNRDYVSGAVYTKNKVEFLYGKLEIRAKLPPGQGIFPAFWLMTAKQHTWLPEIDIFEMLGHQPHQIWMVYHRLNEQNKLVSVSETFDGPDF